jgi:hypothetical protein
MRATATISVEEALIEQDDPMRGPSVRWRSNRHRLSPDPDVLRFEAADLNRGSRARRLTPTCIDSCRTTGATRPTGTS